MTATIDNIKSNIFSKYSSISPSVDQDSYEEKVNRFLDEINNTRNKYKRYTRTFNKLDRLLCELTWVDGITDADKEDIKQILLSGRSIDKEVRKYYAAQRRRYAPKGLFKEEYLLFKDAIEKHRESLDDVENIFFNIRENQKLNDLMSSLNAD